VPSRSPMIVLICAPVTLNFPTAAVVVVGKMTGVVDAETIIPAETIHFLTSMHSLTLAVTLNKNTRFVIMRTTSLSTGTLKARVKERACNGYGG